MAGTKKPRKAYRPAERVEGSLPMSIRVSPEYEYALMLFPHQELEKYKAGEASESSWHNIVSRLNVGQTLAYRHFNLEVQHLCKEALDCMVKVNDRYLIDGHKNILEYEFNIVGFALWFVDEMQKRTTRREFAAALDLVYSVAAIGK